MGNSEQAKGNVQFQKATYCWLPKFFGSRVYSLVLVGGHAGQAEFFEYYFYLKVSVNSPLLLADGLLVGCDPFFHCADAYAVDCSEFG